MHKVRCTLKGSTRRWWACEQGERSSTEAAATLTSASSSSTCRDVEGGPTYPHVWDASLLDFPACWCQALDIAHFLIVCPLLTAVKAMQRCVEVNAASENDKRVSAERER